MLITNCFFRMGCSAALLSNWRRASLRAKYQQGHIMRTHTGSDDQSFRCVYQEGDSQRIKGMSIIRGLLEVGGHMLKANITTLDPLILPFSEQLMFFGTLIYRNLFGSKADKSTATNATKPYIPNNKPVFDHFCVHAASKVVLDELQKNLELTEGNMEASRADNESDDYKMILKYLEKSMSPLSSGT